MIVVTGRVQTDAEHRDELVAVGQAVAVASREEDGCISYRVCQDTEDEGVIVFVEEWATDEALQRHFGTPHIAAFMGAVPALITAPPEVKFHTIASTRDLADVQS